MTVDDLIAACEDVWRGAALANTPQFYGAKGGVYDLTELCALLVLPEDRQTVVCEEGQAAWRCECGREAFSLGEAMVHLNNEHEWPWDKFANKFRDAYHEGLQRAKEGGA